MKLFIFLIFSFLSVSGCKIHISIHDGCDQVSGVPQDKIADALEAIKEDYSEMDNNPPELPKEEVQANDEAS